MGSPSQPNRISTKLEESPSLANLFSDLSPLKSIKSQHSQDFPLSPQPLLCSLGEQNLSKRSDTVQCDSDSQTCIQNHSSQQTEIVHFFQDEQILSPSVPNPVNTVQSCHYIKSKEADQCHRNVSRHLHFGATMDNNAIGNENHNLSNSSLPEPLTHDRIMALYQNEPSAISSSLHTGSPSQSSAFKPTRIPSRFGLPLSNTDTSLSMDSNFSPFKLIGNQNVQEQTQMPSLSARGDFYSLASSTLGSASYPIIEMLPQSDLKNLMSYDDLCKMQMLTSIEDSNKPTPKNRKRAKELSDGEGCKNCNCKRSKCLKLYCECFGAGIYCLDTCGCKNCFNRPDYEDTVSDTRQQIETRNPLAFAPKVVKPNISTSVYIKENATPPSSARHKRGCNCKKSKCLKKYCECYQAGVGCYNGCRCEDCNNCFGRKSDQRIEKWNSPSGQKMKTFEARTDFTEPEQTHQFPSNWENFPNTSLTTTTSQDESKFSHNGSNLQSSTAFNHQHSSDSNTHMLLGRKGLSEINSDRIFHDILEEYPIPGILRKTSTPLKSNKKVMSPPKIQSQELSPRPSFGSRSVRKLDLPQSPLKAGKPIIGDNKEN